MTPPLSSFSYHPRLCIHKYDWTFTHHIVVVVVIVVIIMIVVVVLACLLACYDTGRATCKMEKEMNFSF